LPTTKTSFAHPQVHPDKNPGNELSQPAFEIVKDAHDRLEDPERFTFCARICAAAQEAVERKVAKEKKRLRKEGAASEVVPEDDPATMTLGIKIMISRMFAEFEQRKKMLEVCRVIRSWLGWGLRLAGMAGVG
jgi:hypothetical protein